MAIIMATMDIPTDITMVIGMTTTIGDEIAHRANHFRLKEG
jgi:hypothetical protein